MFYEMDDATNVYVQEKGKSKTAESLLKNQKHWLSAFQPDEHNAKIQT